MTRFTPTLLGCLLLVAASLGAILKKNSFEPPLEDYDSKGQRVVENWISGGDANIMQNYIRVTNDRASKRGWVYNNAITETSSWTLELAFRISGQGQRLYGDGLALWLTSMSRSEFSKGGSLFGAPNKLSGFGILFDTYKNAESGAKHKDIMLLQSDGSKEKEMHDTLPTGCDSDYRFWEKRDDFTATQNSIAVIDFQADQRRLRVRIDAQGTGVLKDCFTYTFPATGDGAIGDTSKLHLALSSSTGQLADNHDVLSVVLRTYGDRSAGRVLPPASPEKFGKKVGLPVRGFVQSHVQNLEKKITELEHELEHRLDAVNDALQLALEKLRDAETEDRNRIDALENRLSAQITKSVMDKTEGKLDKMVEEAMEEALEDALEDALEEALGDAVEEAIEESLEDALKEHKEETSEDLKTIMDSHKKSIAETVASGGRGWVMPFLVLTLMFAGVCYVAYTKYRQLMKTHLL